jgi:Family of unknown function (DUF5675)
MLLNLQRDQINEDADSVFGQLSIDDVFECLTLERLSKIIPAGTYPIQFYFSPHNQLLVPQILVPNREYIEIHPANYATQLLGCVAPGTVHNQNAISNSRFAFSQLMAKIRDQSEISILIEDIK